MADEPSERTATADISGASEHVERFLDLIEHDRPEAAIDLALDRVHEGERVGEIVERLLAPAQRTVGERWHQGRYTVTQEHVASGVVDDVLGLLTTHAPRPPAEHTLALVCAEGEWHTTPARMVALCLRDRGWRVHFLGGSLPADHLDATLSHSSPQLVAISCTLPLALAGVPALVEAAQRHGLPTLAGGIGFGDDEVRARRLGADGLARDAATAAELATHWLDHPPTPHTFAPDPDTTGQRAELAVTRAAVVDATYRALEAQLPAMAAYDDRQQRHTRQDLDYILRFVDATLLVDDLGVFTAFIIWLRDLLAARGVPPAVLHRSLEVTAASLPPELDRARDIVHHGVSLLADDAEDPTADHQGSIA